MRASLIPHIVIAAIWIPLALVLALKIALLGNQEMTLKMGRGNDLKTRTETNYLLDRTRSQLDYEASQPALDAAVRSLGLPLRPATTRIAAR